MPKKDDISLAHVVMFISWYRRNQWDEWLAISADRGAFEDTYDEWIQVANKAMASMKAAGARCIKVDIDVRKFQAWCRLNDRPLDGESRTAYTIELGRLKFDLN